MHIFVREIAARIIRHPLIVLGFVAYTLATIYLRISSVGTPDLLVLPPIGFALAAYLVADSRVLPALWVSTILIHLWAGETPEIALITGTFNTVIAGILGIFVRWRQRIAPVQESMYEIAIVYAASTSTIAALCALGVVVMIIVGYVTAENFWTVWGTWTLSDIISISLITPVVLLLSKTVISLQKYRSNRILEVFLVFIGVVVLAGLAFANVAFSPNRSELTLMLWTAIWSILTLIVIRYGLHAVAFTILLIGVSGLGCVMMLGHANPNLHSRVMTAQGTISIFALSVFSLTFWLEKIKRRRAEGEAKLAQEQLARTETERRIQAFEDLMDDIPIAILFAGGPDCSEVAGNRTACDFFHSIDDDRILRSPKENAPVPFKFVCNVESNTLKQIPLREVASGKELRNSEIAIRQEDGAIRHFLGNVLPQVNSSGKVIGCVAAYIDVTERKRMEEKYAQRAEEVVKTLSRSEQHYRRLVEVSPDAMIIARTDASIVFANNQHWSCSEWRMSANCLEKRSSM
jgi:PAS domain-containing protein